MEPREAVGISLAAVGGTALVGAIPRLLRGDIEWRTGLLFALAGMVGAPWGNYWSSLLPESTLLVAFSLLMLFVAHRMWAQAENLPTSRNTAAVVPCPTMAPESAGQPHQRQPQAGRLNAARDNCQRDPRGTLRLSVKCCVTLSLLGLATGVMSGMFGVGGGFVVVPALVLFSGMRMHQAVATSLFVIFLVSISGVGSYLFSGGSLSLRITLLFIAGGLVGLQAGSRLSSHLSGPNLQKVFSLAIVLVALFVAARSLGGSS